MLDLTTRPSSSHQLVVSSTPGKDNSNSKLIVSGQDAIASSHQQERLRLLALLAPSQLLTRLPYVLLATPFTLARYTSEAMLECTHRLVDRINQTPPLRALHATHHQIITTKDAIVTRAKGVIDHTTQRIVTSTPVTIAYDTFTALHQDLLAIQALHTTSAHLNGSAKDGYTNAFVSVTRGGYSAVLPLAPNSSRSQRLVWRTRRLAYACARFSGQVRARFHETQAQHENNTLAENLREWPLELVKVFFQLLLPYLPKQDRRYDEVRESLGECIRWYEIDSKQQETRILIDGRLVSPSSSPSPFSNFSSANHTPNGSEQLDASFLADLDETGSHTPVCELYKQPPPSAPVEIVRRNNAQSLGGVGGMGSMARERRMSASAARRRNSMLVEHDDSDHSNSATPIHRHSTHARHISTPLATPQPYVHSSRHSDESSLVSTPRFSPSTNDHSQSTGESDEDPYADQQMMPPHPAQSSRMTPMRVSFTPWRTQQTPVTPMQYTPIQMQQPQSPAFFHQQTPQSQQQQSARPIVSSTIVPATPEEMIESHAHAVYTRALDLLARDGIDVTHISMNDTLETASDEDPQQLAPSSDDDGWDTYSESARQINFEGEGSPFNANQVAPVSNVLQSPHNISTILEVSQEQSNQASRDQSFITSPGLASVVSPLVQAQFNALNYAASATPTATTGTPNVPMNVSVSAPFASAAVTVGTRLDFSSSTNNHSPPPSLILPIHIHSSLPSSSSNTFLHDLLRQLSRSLRRACTSHTLQVRVMGQDVLTQQLLEEEENDSEQEGESHEHDNLIHSIALPIISSLHNTFSSSTSTAASSSSSSSTIAPSVHLILHAMTNRGHLLIERLMKLMQTIDTTHVHSTRDSYHLILLHPRSFSSLITQPHPSLRSQIHALTPFAKKSPILKGILDKQLIQCVRTIVNENTTVSPTKDDAALNTSSTSESNLSTESQTLDQATSSTDLTQLANTMLATLGHKMTEA